MLPRFREGDVVVTLPYLLRKPKKGDVVVAEAGGMLILKRVREEAGDLYFLAGDNREESSGTQPVQRRDIVGKVALHSRQELEKGEEGLP